MTKTPPRGIHISPFEPGTNINFSITTTQRLREFCLVPTPAGWELTMYVGSATSSVLLGKQMPWHAALQRALMRAEQWFSI